MKQLTLTSLFVILSPFLIILGFVMMFLCDGAFWPLQVIFPASALMSYLFATDVFFGNLYLLFLIAVFQFPLYGLVIDLSERRKRAIGYVSIFHLVVYLLALQQQH